jgi:hypothetical protein
MRYKLPMSAPVQKLVGASAWLLVTALIADITVQH